MGVLAIKVIGLVFLAVCACSPCLYAQEAATRSWSAAQSRPRSLNPLLLVVTGDRPNVVISGAEVFNSAANRNERAEGPRTPFPVLMPEAIIYPRMAVKKKWEGQTIVAAEVLPDGLVGRTALAKSSGHEILDAAAEDAIKTWKFEYPFENNAGAPPQYVDIPVTFKLQSEDRS
ncbi:MAG: Gram-negative bacterial tonB protein [Candidatus Omnitrophica bacterium ADurb.Bin277]|nr:MAG: Gram-negative bacterial tonB protein [Candidatus Omnitrophica bacterium ADurb.Bin277]